MKQLELYGVGIIFTLSEEEHQKLFIKETSIRLRGDSIYQFNELAPKQYFLLE